MTIRPGLFERLAWMEENVYATYSCGLCHTSGVWCDKCKQSTLDANGGRLPSESAKRKALEEFIHCSDRGTSRNG
jgi:hypothetical protein